jgi:hypothetical protein
LVEESRSAGFEPGIFHPERRRYRDRHLYNSPHSKPEEDTFLDPGICFPAARRICVGLGGANTTFVERGLEFVKRPEVFVAVSGSLAREEFFDFVLKLHNLPQSIPQTEHQAHTFLHLLEKMGWKFRDSLIQPALVERRKLGNVCH